MCRKIKSRAIFQTCIRNVKYLYKEGEMKTMQQGWLSNWLVKHEVVHRSLGFDHRGIETLQIKAGDWDSIAVILYVYGYNYLLSQCWHLGLRVVVGFSRSKTLNWSTYLLD